MSVYEDIQERFEKREAALSQQLHLLSKAAGDVASGLRLYLGLPSHRWTYPDGKVGDAYIRLGVGQKDRFEEKPWMTLSSKGGVVAFSLAVTVVSQSQEFRSIYVFNMSVQFCEDGYLFDVEGDRQQIVSVDDVKAGDLDSVHEMIVSQLKSLLDPERILIKS